MMEEEKLRMKEEEGSEYNEDEKDDIVGDDEVDDVVITKEVEIASFQKSASNMSALSYEMFVESNKNVVENTDENIHDDNNDEEDREEVNNTKDATENDAEETSELVISPGDNYSQRKVID